MEQFTVYFYLMYFFVIFEGLLQTFSVNSVDWVLL